MRGREGKKKRGNIWALFTFAREKRKRRPFNHSGESLFPHIMLDDPKSRFLFLYLLHRTLSWMDAIKRDFGMEHVDYTPGGGR